MHTTDARIFRLNRPYFPLDLFIWCRFRHSFWPPAFSFACAAIEPSSSRATSSPASPPALEPFHGALPISPAQRVFPPRHLSLSLFLLVPRSERAVPCKDSSNPIA